jgi:hypothetical protein
MAKRLLTAQHEADQGPIAEVQTAGFVEAAGAQVAEATAVATVEDAVDLATPLEDIITEFESQSREHHAAIRLSRYDVEVSRAGADLFSPATNGSRGPTVEPSDGAAWATASVEPDVEVAAVMPVAVEAESLDHLRRPTVGNAWILSPPPVEPARVEPTRGEPTRVELASHQTPSTSTEVAIRPASERSVEPPPRLLIVAEPIDAPTLRLRPAVPR